MPKMIQVFDLNYRRVAILQHAYNVQDSGPLNAVGSLSFSLPADDPKNVYCQPMHYVRYGDDGPMHRILTPGASMGDTDTATYKCEHVIATLLDDVLFGQHVIGNLGTHTRDCIQYVLDHQTTKRWILSACDFDREFEYGWENENLLAALWSIPNRLTEPYMWVTDTSSLPWRLSLKRIDLAAAPVFAIREGRNLLSSESTEDAQEICTRLYALGYGEGINQLTIRDVNGGLPYVQSPQEYIDKYGLISRVWVDRRYEDAASLKERALALLDEYQEPRLSGKVNVVDLHEITDDEIDRAELGKAVLLGDGTRTYITGITHKYDEPGDGVQITLATKPADVASSIADLADRQRIEQVYAQGATQLYGQSVQANATPDIGAVLNFYLPEEMRIINKVQAKITLDQFRSYSRSTSGGGGHTATSGGGGSSTTTSDSSGNLSISSSSAGGVSTTLSTEQTTATTESGGKTTQTTTSPALTSAAGGALSITSPVASFNTSYKIGYTLLAAAGGTTHKHELYNHQHKLEIKAHTHDMKHSHDVTIPAHTHSVKIPSHSHKVTIGTHSHTISGGSHSHTIKIPSHTHSVSIPSHTHDIEQGIYEFGNAQSAQIYINGTLRGSMSTDCDTDLTDMLVDPSTGKIPRGRWMEVRVVPNDLAYVSIDLYVQGFVQSRGGSTY